MADDQLDIKQLQAKLFQWWDELKDNKGVRAALRRCRETPGLIRHAKQFVELENRLERGDLKPDRIMPILGLLSHVKKDTTVRIKDHKVRLAEAMALPKNNSSVVSELRFQRILQARDRDELYPLLLRAIKLLDGEINVTDLIYSVYNWEEEKKIRRKWALAYYRIHSQEK